MIILEGLMLMQVAQDFSFARLSNQEEVQLEHPNLERRHDHQLVEPC